ncbi:glycosyltransferase family 2 protein [Vibrio splendidus]
MKVDNPRKLKISVVIPLYNKKVSIVNTINSVLNQSFSDFEIIVIDDGSTDESVDKVMSITDERIKLFSIDNRGVSNARNIGVSMASNEYIYFLDADDTMNPDCFDVYEDLYQKFPNEKIYCTNFGIYNNENAIVDNYCSLDVEGILHNPFEEMYKGRFFTRTGSILLLKSLFEESYGFDERFSYYEDMDFIFRLIKKEYVVYTGINVFRYQVDHSGLSLNVADKNKNWLLCADYSKLDYYQKKVLSVLIFDCMFKCIIDMKFYSLIDFFKVRYKLLPGIFIDKIRSKF